MIPVLLSVFGALCLWIGTCFNDAITPGSPIVPLAGGIAGIGMGVSVGHLIHSLL